jgi:hypothetical protein
MELPVAYDQHHAAATVTDTANAVKQFLLYRQEGFSREYFPKMDEVAKIAPPPIFRYCGV